jgi:hypothetical protein
MLSWVQKPRVSGGILDAGGAPLAFTDWAPLAQDRAGWRKPRCDTRVTPEDKQRFMAQRAAETTERRALFDAAAAAAAL